MEGAVPGVQPGISGLHLLLPEGCLGCLDGDEDLSAGQSGAGPEGKVMTTCLHCSFQPSPLLVLWEPRCLPTMAWLVQLPGFLAWWPVPLGQAFPQGSPEQGLALSDSIPNVGFSDLGRGAPQSWLCFELK